MNTGGTNNMVVVLESNNIGVNHLERGEVSVAFRHFRNSVQGLKESTVNCGSMSFSSINMGSIRSNESSLSSINTDSSFSDSSRSQASSQTRLRRSSMQSMESVIIEHEDSLSNMKLSSSNLGMSPSVASNTASAYALSTSFHISNGDLKRPSGHGRSRIQRRNSTARRSSMRMIDVFKQDSSLHLSNSSSRDGRMSRKLEFSFKPLHQAFPSELASMTFNYAAVVESTGRTDLDKLRLSGVVLYNMALTNHVHGLEKDKMEAMYKALDLYRKSKSCILCTLGGGEKDINIYRLVMAILNNMGQLYSILTSDYDSARKCFSQVCEMISHVATTFGKDGSDEMEHYFWESATNFTTWMEHSSSQQAGGTEGANPQRMARSA